MRLTNKVEIKTSDGHTDFSYDTSAANIIELPHLVEGQRYTGEVIFKLGQLEDIEEELGIDLVTFLKGINPNTCFMEITKDKKFDFCGDAYYGTYSKEELLKLIQNLLFMYWALTREELEK